MELGNTDEVNDKTAHNSNTHTNDKNILFT